MNRPNLVESNKHIFGTYAVMAMNNVQLVFEHIRKMAGLPENTHETYRPEDLWTHPVMAELLKVKKGEPTDNATIQLIVDKMLDQFPFLRIMGENQRAFRSKKDEKKGSAEKMLGAVDIYDVMNSMLRVVKAYRDATEHLMFDSSLWNDGSPFLKYNEQVMAGVIENYYGVALRNVKERFGYTTDDLRFIQDHRMKDVRVPGERFPRKTYDLDFFLSIKATNGDRTGKLHLSGVGVTLLICLLLHKQYVTIMLSKLQGIYGKYRAGSKERQIILRSFAINGIVLPKERIRSDKSEMSVALDMINELKRCPRELFDVLSVDDQERFRLQSADMEDVLQMRHSDRFAQLVMQYFDYGELLPTIRFQVNMGKLRYLFNAAKNCIDGATRVRVLEHRLNAFGRVQEMEAKRKNEKGAFVGTDIDVREFDEVRRDDANPENYPYVVDTYTHYVIENNKINFTFGEQLPEVERVGDKWYVNNVIAHCSMSVLELPAMVFHSHLYGAKKTEALIRRTWDNYNRLFADMRDGKLTKANIGTYGIAEADMPAKVLEAVNGGGKSHGYWAYVRKEIDEMLDDTERRITRLKDDKRAVDSKMNKMGKRGFVRIMPGRLADWLAEDIVRLQRSSLTGTEYGTDRITGLNYRTLQAAIATFNSNHDITEGESLKALTDMLAKAGLTIRNGKTAHPFLFFVLGNKPKNTIDLYESYLIQRKKYLNGLLKKIRENNIAKSEITFVNAESTRFSQRDADYYCNTAADYLDFHAIELPRQMFDAEIKAMLKKLPEMKDVDFDHANVTYLIAEYLKRFCRDDFQPFYNLKRNYRYIDMLEGKTDSKDKLLPQYTTVARREELWKDRIERVKKYRRIKVNAIFFDRNNNLRKEEIEARVDKSIANARNEYTSTEKVIRRYKVQDALMFLLACDTITQNVQLEGKRFKLNAVEPSAETGILSEVMPINFEFTFEGKRYTLHADGMKIKNYGDFFRLINDQRLPSLLNIVGTTQLEKKQMDEELSNYDNCRPEMVKMILGLEKEIYTRFPEKKNLVYEIERFNFSKLMAEMVREGMFSHDDRNTINLIRNAFSHNRYPEKVVISGLCIPEVAKSYEAKMSQMAHLPE